MVNHMARFGSEDGYIVVVGLGVEDILDMACSEVGRRPRDG